LLKRISKGLIVLVCVVLVNNIKAQVYEEDSDTLCYPIHTIGNLVLKVSTSSLAVITYGAGLDCLTGDRVPTHGSEYPKNSGFQILGSSGFAIGGVVNNDTLVSTGIYNQELVLYYDEINSTLRDFENRSYQAVSEQDYLIKGYDNTYISDWPNPTDPLSNRPHKPLYIEVEMFSHAWSYDYAGDIVFMEYKIRSKNAEQINGLYFSALLLPAIYYFENINPKLDDISGLLQTYDYTFSQCEYLDTLFLAWGADNDGDPVDGEYKRELSFTSDGPTKSCPDIGGFFS